MPAWLEIDGGVPLRGQVAVSAAKNAALPALAAALLTSEPVHLENVPALADVATMAGLLETLGASLARDGAGMRVRVERLRSDLAPYELVSTMRASVLVLGPLVARHGSARVALPGGCAIGPRPIDQHLKGLARLGAEIVIENGYVIARASRLKGARITTDLVTVTGTENLMMAAALAEGTTLIENAAREPEVDDLAALLTAMGARIHGAGTTRLEIEGVPELAGATHRIVPDRIEAGTLIVAGAITGGDVTVTGVVPDHVSAVLAKLEECGVGLEVGPTWARARAGRGRHDQPLPGVPHRHAGTAHDAPGPRGRPVARDGDDLREPLHARGRARPDGRADRDRRRDRDRPRRPGLPGRAGDGLRPAGLRGAGARGPRRAGPHDGRARLPSRPGLRAARGQARGARRADRAARMKDRLTLALPKGRLLDGALARLSALGVDGIDPDSRRLIFTDAARGLRVLLLKPADVPAYVLYGAADLGIVGKDILLEQEPDVYEPLDLGFGACRLVVAEPRELWERDDPAKWSWVRVATKYPRLTEQYFTGRGIQVEIVRLDGSIELAPLVGLADRIVDLVQSGETLRANGLVEVAEIVRSTARLIVNRASMKTEHARITGLIEELKAATRVTR